MSELATANRRITVPRLGYRLVRDRSTDKAGRWSPPLLAVVPFQNLDADPEQDYFADGIVQDITTAAPRCGRVMQ